MPIFNSANLRVGAALVAAAYLGSASVRGDVFDIYVDSVNGSDANTGQSPSAAKQTLSAVTLSAGLRIGLARQSHWREQIGGFVSLPNNVTIGAYGTGQLPVIDASDVSAGWTKTAGKTNVYQADLSVGGPDQFLRMYEDGALLKWVADATTCDSTPGTYYCATTTSSPTCAVFLHATGSGNPASNSKVYEHTARLFGIMSNTATGWSVSNVRTKRNLHTDGSLVIYVAGTARGCVAEDGGKHNLWIGADSVAEDCIAWKCDYSDRTGSTLFISFALDGTGKTSTFRRCVAINDISGQNVLGFYAHTQGSWCEWDEIVCEDCSASGVTTGYSMSDCTLYTNVRSFAFNTADGLDSSALDTVVTDMYVKSGGTTQAGGVHLRRAGTIDGLRMYSTFGSYDVYLEGGAGEATVKNSVVVKTAGSGFFNLQLSTADTLDSINNIYWCTDGGGGLLTNGLGDAQGNSYKADIDVNLSGGRSYPDFATYRAANPLRDASSIAADPLLIDPANGDFGVSSGSPAIAIGAGLLRPNIVYTAIPSDEVLAAM